MKKYIISTLILLLLCTFLTAQAGTTQPQQPLGDGTEESPYLIDNLANLRWLSENNHEWWIGRYTPIHVSQTANIDASETINWNDGNGFLPIEPPNTVNGFYGVYNGNNFTISGLYMSRGIYLPRAWGGFFGSIENSTVLKNIQLENMSIVSYHVVGGIVGFIQEAHLRQSTISIENCYTSGIITADTNGMFGGIVGMALADEPRGTHISINNSYSTINFTLTNTQHVTSHTIGGIIGIVSFNYTGTATIENCYFNGKIESEGKVGGIIGQAFSPIVLINNYASGSVISNGNFSGGLAGLLPDSLVHEDSVLQNNFWDVETTGFLHATYEEGTPESNFGLPTDEMKNITNFINAGWDFETVWDINPNINDGYPFLRSFDYRIDPPTTEKEITNEVTTALIGNYPNPFNPTTTISYNLEHTGNVKLQVFNVKGQLVRTLVDEVKNAGEHSITWHGEDNNFHSVASGVYFYRLETEAGNHVQRMLLLK